MPRTLLLATDHKQSVITEVGDAKPSSIRYCAYGQPSATQAIATRLAFNGAFRERSIGWYFLGNGYRIYNPVLRCFHSPDSWSPFGLGGLNGYGYCAGDPLNLSDPTGHMRRIHKAPNTTSTSSLAGLVAHEQPTDTAPLLPPRRSSIAPTLTPSRRPMAPPPPPSNPKPKLNDGTYKSWITVNEKIEERKLGDVLLVRTLTEVEAITASGEKNRFHFISYGTWPEEPPPTPQRHNRGPEPGPRHHAAGYTTTYAVDYRGNSDVTPVDRVPLEQMLRQTAGIRENTNPK